MRDLYFLALSKDDRATMALQNLGMRISETISESTRDISFIGKSPNAEYFDSGEDKIRKIRKQLDSTSERDILDAMKRLVAVRVNSITYRTRYLSP